MKYEIDLPDTKGCDRCPCNLENDGEWCCLLNDHIHSESKNTNCPAYKQEIEELGQ